MGLAMGLQMPGHHVDSNCRLTQTGPSAPSRSKTGPRSLVASHWRFTIAGYLYGNIQPLEGPSGGGIIAFRQYMRVPRYMYMYSM